MIYVAELLVSTASHIFLSNFFQPIDFPSELVFFFRIFIADMESIVFENFQKCEHQHIM